MDVSKEGLGELLKNYYESELDSGANKSEKEDPSLNTLLDKTEEWQHALQKTENKTLKTITENVEVLFSAVTLLQELQTEIAKSQKTVQSCRDTVIQVNDNYNQLDEAVLAERKQFRQICFEIDTLERAQQVEQRSSLVSNSSDPAKLLELAEALCSDELFLDTLANQQKLVEIEKVTKLREVVKANKKAVASSVLDLLAKRQSGDWDLGALFAALAKTVGKKEAVRKIEIVLTTKTESLFSASEASSLSIALDLRNAPFFSFVVKCVTELNKQFPTEAVPVFNQFLVSLSAFVNKELTRFRADLFSPKATDAFRSYSDTLTSLVISSESKTAVKQEYARFIEKVVELGVGNLVAVLSEASRTFVHCFERTEDFLPPLTAAFSKKTIEFKTLIVAVTNNFSVRGLDEVVAVELEKALVASLFVVCSESSTEATDFVRTDKKDSFEINSTNVGVFTRVLREKQVDMKKAVSELLLTEKVIGCLEVFFAVVDKSEFFVEHCKRIENNAMLRTKLNKPLLSLFLFSLYQEDEKSYWELVRVLVDRFEVGFDEISDKLSRKASFDYSNKSVLLASFKLLSECDKKNTFENIRNKIFICSSKM